MNSKQDVILSTHSELVDLSIYSLTAVKKACYKFTSLCSVELVNVDDGKIGVRFGFHQDLDEQGRVDILRQFQNELLDQDLREIVFNETEGVRNLILAHAFSKTTLIEAE